MSAVSPTVVVTGASAGVGRATAIRFAREGYDVGLIARGQAGLDGAARDVVEAGGRAHAVCCDVADAAALEEAADQIEAEFGPIDVWVNNAMVTVYGRFRDLEPDEFRRVVDVTLLGSVWGTRTALARMCPRDHGVIIQVGSALSERGIPLQSAYCASKHALNGFIDSVRTELLDEDSGVSLRVAQMPALNTPQFAWGRSKLDDHPQPVPPIFQPEVAAEAVWYLANNDKRELWVGASTVGTILGDRVASPALDVYLAHNGIDSQKADGMSVAPRRDNLFEPADADDDYGTHGPFDERAKGRSLQLEATKHKGALAAAGSAVAAGAAALWWSRQQD